MNSSSDSDRAPISSGSVKEKQLLPSSSSPRDKDSSTSLPIKPKDLENEKIDHPSKRRRRARTTLITVSPAEFRRQVKELTGLQPNTEFKDSTPNLFPFISHCSLFPLGSEFTKQDLVSLWIAEGLVRIPSVHNVHRAEDVANDIFDSLVSRQVIVHSGFDKHLDFFNPNVRIPLFKMNGQGLFNDQCAAVSDNNFGHVPETVLHLSVQCKTINQVNFEATMKKFVHLRTLFLISSCVSPVEQIPRDLFLWLKHLRSLKLSRTLVSELPCSIGNLKSLRYIDLSYTPIKHLPHTIGALHNLQTLKLRFCPNLYALPNNMSKLTNLRHLDLDVMRQLNYMPPRMGNLTNLQTLSAFLVDKDDGNKIVELKNIANISGAFCISRLGNVSSFEEAKEAALMNKDFLRMLELRWTYRGVDIIDSATMEEEERILEHLQPPLGIEELRIVHYCGSKLPSWISNPCYVSLVDITLCSCRNCEFLPSFGELPSLEILNIRDMNELRIIDHHLYRKDCDQQSQAAFPRLQKLTIEAMPNLEEWTGIQNGDFPILQSLKVEHCPKLVSLPLLSYLNSLNHLELSYCPNLLALPEQGLPSSLESFLLTECPQLKKRCHKGEGQDWGKMVHVPKILVDYEKISWQVNMPLD